jgi:hypothetical protein
VATFSILQFEKLYPDFSACTEDQIIRNDNFDICFKWLLSSFDCRNTDKTAGVWKNCFQEIVLEKAEENWQVVRT